MKDKKRITKSKLLNVLAYCARENILLKLISCKGSHNLWLVCDDNGVPRRLTLPDLENPRLNI